MPHDPEVAEEILVLASDPGLLAELARVLGQAGLRVRTRSGDDRSGGPGLPVAVACAVVELRLPGPSPSALLRSLRQGPGRAPVILVASDPPVPVVVEAMKAGAFDLLERPVDPVRFVERVWEAISVRRSHLAEAAEVQRVESLLENLTRRERQLVELILAGMSTKEVAYELGIREVTVDFHRRNVYKKMGVENSVRLSRMVENYRHRKERLAG